MQFIIDSHSHIQFPAYDEDRAEVITRAREAGVKMLAIGTQISTSQDGIKVAEEYPEDVLGATAGFHPGHLSTDKYIDTSEFRADIKEKFDAGLLRQVAESKRVLAIGECGLDYFRLPHDDKMAAGIKIRQTEVFSEQIKIAHELKKPLVIHCRHAFSDLIDMLVTSRYLLTTMPGVIHFFSGTEEDARRLLDLGFYMSFGGVITFARDYEEVIKFVPLDRILLETDAPYVAPVPYRGRKNEPAYAVKIAEKVAELKNVSYEKVAFATLTNTKTLFRI